MTVISFIAFSSLVFDVTDYDMDKSLMAIGQAGAERLEALAVGLRERIPGESFCRKLVQVSVRYFVWKS